MEAGNPILPKAAGRVPKPAPTGRPVLFPAALAGLLLLFGPLVGQAPPGVTVASTELPGAEREPTGPARRPLDIAIAPEGFLYRVVCSDGRIFFSRFVSGGDPVRLALVPGGVEEVPRSRIARIEQVRGELVDGDFWPQDPNHSRLFFAPTGRNLPRGSGSVNAYYGVMPFLALGVTDRITLAGGVSLVKGSGFELFPKGSSLDPSGRSTVTRGRTVHLAPKIQLLRTRRLETAVGALVFLRTGVAGTPTGIGYAVGTWAPDDRTGITLGAGLGMVRGSGDATPIWMLGADRRLSRQVKLVTESYRFPGGETVHMAGIRRIGERISVDMGLAAHPNGHAGRVFPVFNVSLGW